MSRIKIKYFGPIKEGFVENDGWLPIQKVTVCIGDQGSGKSTVAKLISTFSWIEKALVRGDFDKKWFEPYNRLKTQLLPYHRLENYFTKDTYLAYQGERYTLEYKDENLSITEHQGQSYALPQIMYVPAERNFIAYVKRPKELKVASESLNEFLTEFDYAKTILKKPVLLPINNTSVEYDQLNDVVNLKREDYRLRLTDASSGFQSLVPMYLVSDYLSEKVAKSKEEGDSMSVEEQERFRVEAAEILTTDLTAEQKRIALSILSNKFTKTAFVNIVEEPEQNLFPSSQWEMLKSLLMFNNRSVDNKLILTTHSPYIINYLNIAIYVAEVQTKIEQSNQPSKQKEALQAKLEAIVPSMAGIALNQTAIYELDEQAGTIKALPSSFGILSNKNYLNDSIKEGNILFDQLLEIEELC